LSPLISPKPSTSCLEFLLPRYSREDNFLGTIVLVRCKVYCIWMIVVMCWP